MRGVVAVLVGTLAVVALARPAPAAPIPAPVTIGRGERLVVVAPHPDDETLAAGGLIQRVLERDGTVRIVLVTAGDGYVEAVAHATGRLRPPSSDYVAYGRRRLGEARAAIRDLGGDRPRIQFLGFPDGGLDGLLRAHWYRDHPERSRTTGASDPPYDDAAIAPDLPYDGADLRRELARLLSDDDPTIVVLPDPLDKHPDHRAAGLFTMLALDDWLASSARRDAPPRLFAYLVHWPSWPPLPERAGAARLARSPIHLPKELPARGGVAVLALDPDEVGTKRTALARYASQQREMPALLASFVRATEAFTVLDPADLTRTGAAIEAALPPTPSTHAHDE